MKQSADLAPGTRLRWTGPHSDNRPDIAVLERRKKPGDDHHNLPFRPGWWVEGGGGLADYVIDAADSKWEVIG